MKKHNIFVVGIGPGEQELMSAQAVRVLEQCDVIVGYPVYINLLGEHLRQKQIITTPMREEIKRCRICFEEARKGRQVALVCSGDAGVYGLASLMYEIGEAYPDCELTVVAGITAANSGAALLGAPLNHDYCIISLSDLLTPWELIEKRLRCAASGDFCIALYNPSSHRRVDHLRRACCILLEYAEKSRACGLVENIGRENTKVETCTLGMLQDKQVNMFTTVFIGNSQTRILQNKLVTNRGYHIG